MQMTYPGTKISTLEEVFDFVECADPEHQIRWNIESKIDPVFPNKTKSVQEFVERQHNVFVRSPYRYQITVRILIRIRWTEGSMLTRISTRALTGDP